MLAPSSASPQQEAEPLELRPHAERRLVDLQDLWLDWLTAIQAGEEERAQRAVEDLLTRTREVGMERLPELSLSAATRAVMFARAGDGTRAAQALAAAEALDPGRPDTAFASAAVGRAQGHSLRALRDSAIGLARIVKIPVLRHVAGANWLIWAMNLFALLALAFVGIQMATRGQVLYRDLCDFFSRSVPVVVAQGLTLAILLWPILLPSGLLWLAFFWSVLLWGYASRIDRVVMVFVWLFFGALPVLVTEQVQRTVLALSRPVQAVENVAQGRLEGDLFQDLGILDALLPESVAVQHTKADLYLKLRHWDEARRLYGQVVAAEPFNSAAYSGIGTAYFYKGDLAAAAKNLKEAVTREDPPAEAYFNLSRVYSEQRLFNEAEPMMRRASAIDSGAVSDWLRVDDAVEVISASSGFERGDEIRRELESSWREGGAGSSLVASWRRTVSLPLAFVFVLPAIALQLLKSKSGNRSQRIDENWFDDRAEVIRQALLPGIAEAERGSSLRSLAALLLLIVLLTLPLNSLVAYRLPVGFQPTSGWLWWPCLAGLILFFAVRFGRARAAVAKAARKKRS